MKILYKSQGHGELIPFNNSVFVNNSRIDGFPIYYLVSNLDEHFVKQFTNRGLDSDTSIQDDRTLMFLRTEKLNKILKKKINSPDMDEFISFLQYYYINRHNIMFIFEVQDSWDDYIKSIKN